jgi:phenylacetate-CoA ligase
MLKVKGVKTWPSAVKDVLSQMTPELSGVFRIILSEKPEAFAVRGPVKLRVEYIPQLKPEELPQLKKRIVEAIRTALVWSPDEVELVPEGTIPRVEMKSRYIEIEDGAK